MYVLYMWVHTCVLLKEDFLSVNFFFYVLQKSTLKNVAFSQRSIVTLHHIRLLLFRHIIAIPISPIYTSTMLFSLSITN